MDNGTVPVTVETVPPIPMSHTDVDTATPADGAPLERGPGPDSRPSSPAPSSVSTQSNSSIPLRLAAAIEKLIGTLPDEFGTKKADAEQRYLDALERTTMKLRKLSKLRPSSATNSSLPSDAPTPSHSETEESDEDLDSTTEHLEISHTQEVDFRTRRWIEERHEWAEIAGEEPRPAPLRGIPEDNHAFTFRTYDGRHGDRRQEATIHCPKLRKLLATELKHYPFEHWDLPHMKFRLDFFPLVHNWKRLECVADTTLNTDSCGTHLRRLLDAVRKCKNVNSYLRHLERGIKTVHYRHLGYLFPPGEVVFANASNQPQAFRVCDYRYEPRMFQLFCWTYVFDGISFNREPFRFVIDKFSGSKQIRMLRCYPLKYHENKNMRTILLEKGRKFRALVTREKEERMFDYKGNIYLCSERPEDVFGEKYAGAAIQATMIASIINHNRGRRRMSPQDDLDEVNEVYADARTIPYSDHVIVDIEAYNSYGPQWPRRHQPLHRPEPCKECDCIKCQTNPELQELLKVKYDNVRKLPSGDWPEFEEEQLLICPPRVAGYALAKKLWVFMEVDNLQPINKLSVANSGTSNLLDSSDWAFDKVILPDDDEWIETKDLIRTLIRDHTNVVSRKEPGIPAPLHDLVEGKGKGLVILLYGESGVGKTLMAETVASYTGKPLLKVSVADIGLTITTVEEKLEEHFHIATRWNAVLLFDEADILLEQRTDEADLLRNSMVSVFLKVLEYYEGILLLTTNRLLTFDIAVQSRVHLAVQFPQMNERVQKRVINMFLDQIAREDIDYDEIHRWVNKRLNSQFNGRQIRNILSAAINRARTERRKLQLEDIEIFWNRASVFQTYLAAHTSQVLSRQLAPNQIH